MVLVIVISIIHSNNTYFTSIPIQLAESFVNVTKGNKSFKIPSTSVGLVRSSVSEVRTRVALLAAQCKTLRSP